MIYKNLMQKKVINSLIALQIVKNPLQIENMNGKVLRETLITRCRKNGRRGGR